MSLYLKTDRESPCCLLKGAELWKGNGTDEGNNNLTPAN